MLREKIRRSLLIEAFLKVEVESKGAVSPAELRAYYDKNQAASSIRNRSPFRPFLFFLQKMRRPSS